MDDNDAEFTERFIKPQLIESAGTMETSIYSIDAKPTKTTFAETFSSGDDEYGHEGGPQFHGDHVTHTFSAGEDDYREELNGTFESVEDERDQYLSGRHDEDSIYSSAGEFINLAQEAAQIPSRHYRSATTLMEHEFENYAETYGLEEHKEEEEVEQEYDGTVLHFVDSEDGQAFSFRTRRSDHRLAAILTHEQNSARPYRTDDGADEATSIGYDTCSKTLNTNSETLRTDLEGVNYIPTGNKHDVVHDPAYRVHRDYHRAIELHGEGESYDDDEERIGAMYSHHRRNAAGVPIPQNGSYLYEDDGFIHYNNNDDNHHGYDDYDDIDLQKQDTFQETVTTYQDTITEYTKDTRAIEMHDGERTEVLSQLMDSYLSDRSSSSSWDEGSYASASRTVSRLDSFDGTEYTEDGNRGGGILMGILNSFRDMKMGDRRPYSDDEDEDEDARDSNSKKTKKSRRRSRRKSENRSNIGSVLGQIGAMGMDLLNDSSEQNHKGSKRSRRRRRRDDHGGQIIDSFRDIFSCGNPGRY
jgi:hypothetical protein